MKLNKTTWLTILVIVLALLNVWTFFFRGHRGHKDGPKKYIIEQLQFTEEQQQRYEEIIANHRSRIGELEHELHGEKDALYQLLSGDANKQKIDSAYQAIANTHQQIESTHFNHFLDIRSICTPEQQPLFNELTKEFGRLFQPGRRAHEK